MKLTCPLECKLPTFRTLLRTRWEETLILSMLTGLLLLQAFGPVNKLHYPLLRHMRKERRVVGPRTLKLNRLTVVLTVTPLQYGTFLLLFDIPIPTVLTLTILKPPARVLRNCLDARLPRLPIIWPQLRTASRSVRK